MSVAKYICYGVGVLFAAAGCLSYLNWSLIPLLAALASCMVLLLTFPLVWHGLNWWSITRMKNAVAAIMAGCFDEAQGFMGSSFASALPGCRSEKEQIACAIETRTIMSEAAEQEIMKKLRQACKLPRIVLAVYLVVLCLLAVAGVVMQIVITTWSTVTGPCCLMPDARCLLPFSF